MAYIVAEQVKECRCLDTDARACWDLRYYGRSPVVRGRERYEMPNERAYLYAGPDDGECVCMCHYDRDDD